VAPFFGDAGLKVLHSDETVVVPEEEHIYLFGYSLEPTRKRSSLRRSDMSIAHEPLPKRSRSAGAICL
jgi:hypothetical protein